MFDINSSIMTDNLLAIVGLLIIWIVLLIVTRVNDSWFDGRITFAFGILGSLLLIVAWTYVARLEAMRVFIYELIKISSIAIVVIFQPEIRESIENMRKRNVTKIQNTRIVQDEVFARELLQSVKELSLTKTGALITIQSTQKLTDYMTNATQLNSDFSRELVKTIFNPNTILHDGAIIIDDKRIVAASVYYPVNHEIKINKKLGTRHLAALSISEKTDSLSIIISEENGAISLAQNGKLDYNVSLNEIRQRIGA
jgi:diadenylate cyclase